MNIDSRQLFSNNGKLAFEQGAAAQLVMRRNGQLGNLLNTERGVFYIQILYGLLRLRRAHELEPLHDDLYTTVKPAQETLLDGGDYNADRFREDVAALLDWKLIEQRIELERLRGYRDARRRKFRYSLADETIAFLEWLEERLQADLEERSADTRDLLESVCGALRELSRVLYRVQTKNTKDGDARRVLFQLGHLDQLTHLVSDDLVFLNARMYGFVMRHYAVAEARQILRELETFVEVFLKQIHLLRGEIIDMLGALQEEKTLEKIRLCVQEMEAERRQAPHLMRRVHDPANLQNTPAALKEFYREDGTLDTLCRRINATATSVWRKLHLHLRELERKNHRLEDLRARINEIATLPEESVPDAFLFELIAPAQLYTDSQYWDEHEKAMPPEPRRGSDQHRNHTPLPLSRKSHHDGPVRTLEQRRLDMLREWLEARIITPMDAKTLLANGDFDGFDDLARVMELVKAGRLGCGRKLKSIGYQLTQVDDKDVFVADDYILSLPALCLERGDGNGRK